MPTYATPTFITKVLCLITYVHLFKRLLKWIHGLHVNAAKTWLVVKQGYLAQAQRIFDGTGIQIMSAGRPYLGAPLGSRDFIADYTQDRVSQ